MFRRLISLLTVLLLASPAVHASSYGEVQLSPSNRATFIASSATFTAATSATDMFQIYGSSSKKVQVLKIYCTYTQAASSSEVNNNFYVIRRSTANSSGTAVTETAVAPDSSDQGNATAAVKHYTANPTTGTSVGQIACVALGALSSGSLTGIPQGALVLYDADKYGKAVTLSGTSDGLVVNNNGATVAGTSPVVQFTVVWTEQ